MSAAGWSGRTHNCRPRYSDCVRSLSKRTNYSNEKIGNSLFISEATARTHMSNIFFKLSLDNRTQAALYALREGWASLDEIGDITS